MDDDDVHVVDVHMAESSDLDAHAQQRIFWIDGELARIREQLRELHKQRDALVAERATILAEQREVCKAEAKERTDYMQYDFPWSQELLRTAQRVFGIKSFRSCQEGVCNAAMDHRDVMVVMPTGAGKSLCYQLPALLSASLVVVVSPLVALMNDQVYHLRERGVACELLCSSMPQPDTHAILKRVRTLADDMPRLLYVTPERIAKSKTLLSALQNVYEAGRLERIVIDEAHCCSMMGHDYRPDYQKLSVCRRLFPSTPLMGLTATLGSRALRDVLKILGMRETTPPTHAIPRRTVYFRAPLERPNLRYSVRMRPTSAAGAHEMVVQYIQKHHAGHSGIVYCLSRRDTHTMAEALARLSHGTIRTGVYHSDLDETEKHAVHTQWRTGAVQVVCATIAFGMGIDKGDVRFVVHACVSKSVEGYYQESGRAGRDGEPADCVLLYRPTDMSRLSGMTAGEAGAEEKVHAMLAYAQTSECRQMALAAYFDEPRSEPCGVCDRCTQSVEPVDVSLYAWQVVRGACEVHAQGGRVTLAALADAVRGVQRGQFKLADEHGRPTAAKAHLDLGCMRGAVPLSRDDCEALLVQLVLDKYLEESYQATAYTVNVYVVPGARAQTLARVPPDEAALLTGRASLVLTSTTAKRKRT